MAFPPGDIDPKTMAPGHMYKILTKIPHSDQLVLKTVQFIGFVNKRWEMNKSSLRDKWINDPSSTALELKVYYNGRPIVEYSKILPNSRYYPITTNFPEDLDIMRNLSGPLTESKVQNAAWNRKKHAIAAWTGARAEIDPNYAAMFSGSKTRKARRSCRKTRRSSR